jgi:hypothetical protein
MFAPEVQLHVVETIAIAIVIFKIAHATPAHVFTVRARWLLTASNE